MKLWNGRFEGKTDKIADEFNSSLSFDFKLFKYDILGSIAHCTMLGEQKIIPPTDAKKIIDELNLILKDIQNQIIDISDAEDIHSFVENELTKRIGDVGKKLHTARSRNDQVALDMRMYQKDSIINTSNKLKILCEMMLELAQKYADCIMPGYTHMQKAQPITLGHYFNAYVCMFMRDIERLKGCYERTDCMPLGSGALAGTTYPINRCRVSEILDFSSVSVNSIDAVSDRDFIFEYISAINLVMIHLSKISEEWIYWSGDEFGFINLDDAYSTGSSIMPQKKNPDMLELIRGKSSRVSGHLCAFASLLKALPLAYNKDLQEDKEAVFDTEYTVNMCLDVFLGILKSTSFNTQKMLSSASGGFSAATDIADYLTKKGLPFRDSHKLTGEIVLYCIKNNTTIEQLKIDDFKNFSLLFDIDILNAVKIQNVVNNRTSFGGTSPIAVKESIQILKDKLKKFD